MIEPLPFQRLFLARAFAAQTRIAALSIPRGNGKSTLAAHVLERCLTPGDDLNEPGKEYLLLAASIEQARHVFRPIRDALEPTGHYRFVDSQRSLGITDKRSNTKLRVVSSNGKTAMGIVGCPVLVADEPGAWENTGGALMWDAIATAMGKPGSTLRVILIGTLAPARHGWWHKLIADGSRGSIHVTALMGNPDQWDRWAEIRRCNPLMATDKESRRQLRDELDEAKQDTRLKARFLSYRLNLPTADESEILLTADRWKAVLARRLADPEGRPIVGVDLGQGRSWSAAVAIWPNGRTEALAVAPGIPDLTDQEKRDRVPAGMYHGLAESGRLMVAEGLRVPPVGELVDEVCERWDPEVIIADRFRASELQDWSPVEVIGRVTRWSEAAADIRALRKMALDGPMNVQTDSRLLLTASLAVSMVKSDDQGNTRLVKRGTNSEGRDDVVAALLLAAGERKRRDDQAASAIDFMLLSPS